MRSEKPSHSKPLSTVVRQSLVRLVFLPTVVILVTTVIAGMYMRQHEMKADQLRNARWAATWLQSYVSDVAQVLGNIPVVSIVDEADSHMFEFLVGGVVARLMVLDGEYRVVASWPEDLSGKDYSGIAGVAVNHTGLDQPEGNGSSAVQFTRPYFSEAERGIVVGAVKKAGQDGYSVFAELMPQTLQTYIQALSQVLPDQLVFVTDAYGNILAHPDITRVQQQTNVGHWSIIEALDGQETAVDIARIEGSRRIVTARKVPTSGWLVVVSQDVVEVYGPIVLSFLIVLGVITVIIFGLVLVLQRRMSRHVVQPLAALAHSIEVVGSGRTSEIPRAPSGVLELETLTRDFLDMSETIRRREQELRKSEERWHFALEGAGDGVWDWNVTTGDAYFSPRFEQMLGYEPGTLIPLVEEWWNRVHPDDMDGVKHVLDRAVSGEIDVISGRYRFRTQDGSFIWILGRGKVISRGEDGKALRVIGTQSDINSRVRIEESLRRAASENEALLREVHHRVKNNLNVVASLLSLQSDAIDSVQAAQNALDDSKNRIYSIAQVHEHFYASEDLSTVDMRSYITKLVSGLEAQYNRNMWVKVITMVDEIPLGIDQAIPCGIILNELVSNAFKHAFPEPAPGEIRVRFHWCPEEQVELEVQDNGVGLDVELLDSPSETLGLQIVRVLTQQVGGKLHIAPSTESETGTEFVVRWSVPHSDRQAGVPGRNTLDAKGVTG